MPAGSKGSDPFWVHLKATAALSVTIAWQEVRASPGKDLRALCLACKAVSCVGRQSTSYRERGPGLCPVPG